ncbi:MAG TPA: hypothetical protein RMH99_23070 [Sandaracinaceae bacterium LLY-WYZ-13_1]|nr:hypothetical protein [Sandaracinaceae bacterium LLY-WYZ-13_1]
MSERVEVRNPNTGRSDGTIAADKYEAMKAALLRVIPDDEAGVPFRGLADRVRPHLPAEVFAGASVGWYTTTVKLDLEARGLIERVPKRRPQHLRRR